MFSNITNFYKNNKIILLQLLAVVPVFTLIFSGFNHKHWNGIEKDKDKYILNKLGDRMYFTLSTLSTIRDGNISPKNVGPKIFVMILQILVIIKITSLLKKNN